MKKYFKKSISLFLAVLMVLSCWVWIAPTEANADHKTGQYYVKVYVDVETYSEKVSNAKLTVHYKKNNGKGEAGSTYQSPASSLFSKEEDNKLLFEGYVDGFPTSANFYCYLSKKFGGTTLRVGYLRMYVGKDASSCTNLIAGNRSKDSMEQKASTINGDKTFDFSITTGYCTDNNDDYTEKYPYIKTIDAVSDEEKTIPDINAVSPDDTVSTTAFTPVYWDQYGVKWIPLTAPTVSITDVDGSIVAGSSDADKAKGFYINKSNDSIQAVITKDMQKNYLGENNNLTKTYYLTASVKVDDETYTASQKIDITYPKYTVTVNAEGASVAMSDDTNNSGTWTESGVYATEIESYPTGGKDEAGNYLGATKPGSTFKGFWTNPQPATGNASFNAESADFATPVSTTQFNTYCTQAKDTDGDMFVTVENEDGTKSNYYNAGTEWDAEKNKSITNNATFYAWWLAADIPVKFYDIDGRFMGTQIGKAGTTPNTDWYPNPKDYYNAGAYEYETFTGQWMDISGDIITEGSYEFGEHESLTLTPVYSKNEYKATYDVTFINPSNGQNFTGTDTYDYRHVLSYPTPTVPGTLKNDYGYSYVFSGWSSQKPAKGNYHVVAADDTTFVENTDWAVRADVTYYAVFRSTLKEYVVSYTYKDTTGTTVTDIAYVPYGAAVATPSNVNLTYATGGYGFNLASWKYTAADTTSASFLVNGTIILNETNVAMAEANLKGQPTEAPIPFTAHYGEGQPTPYTVTFKYMAKDGTEITKTEQVYNDYAITKDVVDKITVPEQYDDGKALYTFSGKWNVTEGIAAEPTYKTEDLADFYPRSHVTFEAVYGEGVPFYTVKYIDGANSYEERVLAGNNIPAWMVDGEEYVPTKADSETGEYIFAGWFDAAQTDKNYAATNGKEYTLSDKVTADITLYSQFIFSPFTFTVKFVNYDGAVLAEGEYEAGESFEDIYLVAENNASKPADKRYYYTFVGWDNDPGKFICAGEEMTFIAQYRPNYITYKARWYTDYDAMIDADLPEMEFVGSNGLLAITSHTYEGSVYAPSVALTAPANKVFDKWMYIKDGVETAYVRGMKITDSMSFYATYKDAPVTYTLTAIVGGETYTYELAAGSTAEVAGTPVDGYVDKDSHNEFLGWFTADDKEFDLATVITADITITAKFTVLGHDKSLKELVTVPTYYAKGSEKIWCACSRKDTEETVEIDMLTDTVAPTGTIYLGTQGSWSSTDVEGAAATDNDAVAFFANDDTDIILIINDTGDVNAYNASGTGKGVALVQGIISTGVFGADTTEIAGIKTIFSDSTETLNNTANYVIRLGTYEGLVDGDTYIAYYYVKDKAGNVLNKNVRTAKFIYDITAPEFTITGDNNKATAGTVTYCGTATITDIEAGATLFINDEETAYTNGQYVINAKGNYLVKVVDKAGNSTTEKIKVTAGHDEITTKKAVTCTEDGYNKIVCAVCDKVLKKETITSEGHKYSDATTVAPTCTAGGYDIKVCSVCGDEDKTNETPAAGHTYNKDGDGNIIYTVINAATCATKGKKIANCAVCGKGTLTEEIPVDTVNGHVYGAVKTLKPTCTEDGEEYQHCKYCHTKNSVSILPALNHIGTDRITKITTAATCFSTGVETEYCKACGAATGVTEEIPMIGHTLVLVKHDTEADKSTEYPDGYMQYECQANGCTHTEGKEAIAAVKTYTAKFYSEDGETLIYTGTVNYGESIAKDDVTEPTKAATVEYEYTFAGWKSSSGNLVKLPVKVTKDETYTAVFTETAKVYTHKFVDDEGKEIANIVGNYNDEGKKTNIIPTKQATTTTKYEFAGWVKLGTNFVATDFTMTGDTEFEAIFREIPIEHTVIYIYGSTILDSHKVDGGKGVPEYAGSTDALVKDYDSNYHYEFEKWSIAKDTPVYADTYIQPLFKATKHDYDEGEVTTAPTCVSTGVKTFTCECGKQKTDSVPATGEHVKNADGVCVNCGYTDTIETVTIYFKGESGTIYSTSVLPGETVTYTVVPTKDSTAQYHYSFKGWKEFGSDKEATKQTEFKVDKDVTYIAEFEKIERVYTVTYYNGGKPVKKYENVAYNAYIPGYFETPTKAYNDNEHYVFIGWSVNNEPTESIEKVLTKKIIGDTAIYAKYDTVRHNLGEIVPGTCAKPAHQICTGCGYVYEVPGASSVAHTPDETSVEINDSTFDVTGTKTYYCTSCKQTITEIIPVKAYYYINIMVWNDDGSEAQYANVKLKHNGEFYDYYEDGKETVDGFVSFKVDKSLDKKLWSAYIVGDGIEGGISGAVKTATNTDTNINEFNKPAADVETPDVPQPEEPEEPECSCSCHKNTFWGMIFRFFQKIVRFFGGKDCCADARK